MKRLKRAVAVLLIILFIAPLLMGNTGSYNPKATQVGTERRIKVDFYLGSNHGINASNPIKIWAGQPSPQVGTAQTTTSSVKVGWNTVYLNVPYYGNYKVNVSSGRGYVYNITYVFVKPGPLNFQKTLTASDVLKMKATTTGTVFFFTAMVPYSVGVSAGGSVLIGAVSAFGMDIVTTFMNIPAPRVGQVYIYQSTPSGSQFKNVLTIKDGSPLTTIYTRTTYNPLPIW